MQYLLGQAPPEDQSSFEERIVTDNEFYEELVIAEDELIDQYLSGELSESEREGFENYFLLEPERQRKLRFGRAFNRLITTVDPIPDASSVSENVSDGMLDVPKPPPKPRPWYKIFLPSQNPVLAYSLMAALVLIVAGAAWYALRNSGPTDPGKVYIAELTPGGPTRSGGVEERLTIPAGTGTVEFQLQLVRDEYKEYRAALLSDQGSEIWRAANLHAKDELGKTFVIMNVPSRLLPPGYYSAKVNALKPDGSSEDLLSYRFRILQ